MAEKRKFQIGDDGEIKEGDPILSLWEEEKIKRSASPWRRAARSIIPTFVIFQMIAFTLLCGFLALAVMGFIDLDQVRCRITNSCRTATPVLASPSTTPPAAPALVNDVEQACDPLAARPNEIAFISTKASDFGVVYLVNKNAAKTGCRLFSSDDGIYALAWSRDGKRIAFLGSRGIWLADPDGTNQKLIYSPIDDAFDDDSLDWSPDGKQIAIAVTQQSSGVSTQNIFTVAVENPSSHAVTKGNAHDHSPEFSPDGKQIAFASDRDGNEEIYTVDVDGNNLRRLTNNDVPDLAPSWSPDGKQIVFASDWEGYFNLFLMDSDGSNRRHITSDKARAGQPVWSPDGKLMTFVSYRDGNNEIYVIDAGGGIRRRLTFNNQADDYGPVWVR